MFYKSFTFLLFTLTLAEIVKKTVKRDRPFSRDEPRIFATCVENLGCIDTTEKWYHPRYRPINLEPLDRHTIRTEFLLLKANPENDKDILFDVISNQSPESVKVAGYKDAACLKMLIHDFTSTGHAGWIKHMAKAFLEVNPCNVVSVNWQSGAEPPFDQAIANGRIVALEIYAFLKTLQEHFHLDVKHEVQLVGHGVGAHVAGYVGKAMQKTKLPKITGLDPTGPRFEHMPPVVRLDAEDAKFVEVLHTDAFNSRSQGTMQAFGRADYYLNNAGHQPGCNDSWTMPKFTDVSRDCLRAGKILPACSHKRAYKYYISAALNRDCPFIGIPCENYKKFANGSCTDCKKHQCLIMRYDSFSSDIPKYTKVFLNTNAEPPFCMHTYEIAISIANHYKTNRMLGYFEFILVDDNNKVSFASPSIDGSMARIFLPGYVHFTIAYAPPPEIDKIKEAKVKWMSNDHFKIKDQSIFVKYVTVMRISETMNAPINGLCPEPGPEIKHSDYVHFNKCDVSKLKVGEQIMGAIPPPATPTGNATNATAKGGPLATGHPTSGAYGNGTGVAAGTGAGGSNIVGAPGSNTSSSAAPGSGAAGTGAAAGAAAGAGAGAAAGAGAGAGAASGAGAGAGATAGGGDGASSSTVAPSGGLSGPKAGAGPSAGAAGGASPDAAAAIGAGGGVVVAITTETTLYPTEGSTKKSNAPTVPPPPCTKDGGGELPECDSVEPGEG